MDFMSDSLVDERKELLVAYHFFTLQEVRLMAEEGQQDYNCSRPH
jgi:hypothetical protein